MNICCLCESCSHKSWDIEHVWLITVKLVQEWARGVAWEIWKEWSWGLPDQAFLKLSSTFGCQDNESSSVPTPVSISTFSPVGSDYIVQYKLGCRLDEQNIIAKELKWGSGNRDTETAEWILHRTSAELEYDGHKHTLRRKCSEKEEERRKGEGNRMLEEWKGMPVRPPGRCWQRKTDFRREDGIGWGYRCIGQTSFANICRLLL